MSILPDIILHKQGCIWVARDDLLPGGTKRRAIPALLGAAAEYVYASPCQGHAQVALALACRDHGKRATIVCAARKSRLPQTIAAAAAGANIIEVRPGYLSVVTARARLYAAERGACLLPFGLDCPAMVAALAAVARALPLPVPPLEVWSVAGSGTLQRGLQAAWPDARFFAVRIGAAPNAGKAEVIQAPERYEQTAQEPPPFPSCGNYDAKAWRFVSNLAKPGALFWNVAS